MSCEKTGVCVSRLPTMTRSVWITLPPLTTRRVYSGMLTQTKKSPSDSGIQRHSSMLTRTLRVFGGSGAAAAFSCRPCCRPRTGRVGPRNRLAPFQGEIFLAQGFELRMLRVQGPQIGVGVVALDAWSMTWPGSSSGSLRSRLRLREVGSARPPRAWRAYFRMARLRAISASARLVRDRSEPGGGQSGQLKGRGVEAPVVGAADLGDRRLGGRREAGGGGPNGLLLAARVELGECGAILAVGGGKIAGLCEPLGEFLGKTDGAGRSAVGLSA